MTVKEGTAWGVSFMSSTGSPGIDAWGNVFQTSLVRGPVAVGAKCPWMEQLSPTAKVVPQVLAKSNWEASVRVTVMLVMIRVAVPVLVRVTDCEARGIRGEWTQIRS